MREKIFTSEYLAEVSEVIGNKVAERIDILVADTDTHLNDLGTTLNKLSNLLGFDGKVGRLLREACKSLTCSKEAYEALQDIITGNILNE